MKLRDILKIVSFYILPVALIVVIFGGFFEGSGLKHFSIELGNWAINLFIFIMFIKPFSVFFSKCKMLKKLVLWRKELGIAIFYLAFFHMVGIFIATDLWSYPREWISGFENIPILLGTISLMLMFVLYLTSNRISLKKMKKNWYKLHYLSYPALFFALLHKFGLEKDSYIPAFVVFVVFVALKVFEWKKLEKY